MDAARASLGWPNCFSSIPAHRASRHLPQPSSCAFQDGYLFFTIADCRVFATALNSLNMNALTFITVQLKSWFDAIARAGVTFKYTESGPVGLLQGKKVYVATSRGGMHKDAPTDTQFPHLKMFLAFIGLTDVEYVFIEGQGYGPEVAAQQKAAADARVEELLA